MSPCSLSGTYRTGPTAFSNIAFCADLLQISINLNQHTLAAQQFLLSIQNPDGGWPYRRNAQSSPEPSCYCLMFLNTLDEPATGPASARALGWLQSRTSHNGALTLLGDTEPHWSTSLLALALAGTVAHREPRDRAVAWLLKWEGMPVSQMKENTLNGSLKGWPWIGDTFSWVEPTSYALLALKRCGMKEHPRVSESEHLLLDRLCEEGGWNYGNRNVLGANLKPFVPTTALAALALQDFAPAKDAITLSLSFLEHEISQHQSALSLALSILCFSAFGKPTTNLVQLLQSRQEKDGSWRQQTDLTALAALALQAAAGGSNVFKLPGTKSN